MSNLPPPLPKPTLNYGTSEFAACPKCGAMASTRVTFTWWGGLLGPKMFTHVKCPNCKATYNGKTGQSNNTAILIYSIVSLAIAFVLIFLIIFVRMM